MSFGRLGSLGRGFGRLGSARRGSAPVAATTTLNPSDKSATITLSNGNLTAACNTTSGDPQVFTIAQKSSGKFYFEVTLVSVAVPSSQNSAFGFASASRAEHALTAYLGSDARSGAFWLGNVTAFYVGGTPTNVAPSGEMLPANGNVYGFAFDIDAGKAWIKDITKGTGWNNGLIANQNPATGAGGMLWTPGGLPYVFGAEVSVSPDSVTFNFGASAYVGTAPSGFSNL